MQQLMYVGHRRLEWRDAPEPRLQREDDALVRPFVATRCDGDKLYLLHDFERALRFGSKLGLMDRAFAHGDTDPFHPPFAYGHEGVAEVLACGPEVRRFRRGDRVIVPWALACGVCPTCQSGSTSSCGSEPRRNAFGFGKAFGENGGMMSDVVRVPRADFMLSRVPEGVDPVARASAGDNLADGYRAVAGPLEQRPGAPVLIVGGSATSVGLYAAGLAVALGGSRVDYLDTDPEHLRIAERLGANPIPLARSAHWFRAGEPRRRGGYGVSVEASCRVDGLHYALRALGPSGICTAVGFYLRRGTPLPLFEMYLKDVAFKIGVSHACASLPSVLALVASGVFDPALVTTAVADWQDAPRLFAEPCVKPVVRRPPLTVQPEMGLQISTSTPFRSRTYETV